MARPITPLPATFLPQRMVAAHQITLCVQTLNGLAVWLGVIDWREGLSILSLNLLIMFALVLCPRCRLLGPNFARLPNEDAAQGAVALTFDDGPDPTVTPLILDILERYDAHASFFCVGQKAARHPELIREILRRGHSVENHSDRHAPAFAAFGAGALLGDILAAQRVLSETGGQIPRYFRAPMGFRSPLLAGVLRRLDLTHVAWTRRGYDRILRDPHRVYQRLIQGLTPGDILLLHDTRSGKDTPPLALEVLPLLLDHLATQGLRAIALPPNMGIPHATANREPSLHS
ncbi:hypothetical protein BI364_05205 [Acidihalobacter yilgarnensis]|uniref:NodB homology domain-containing protein n=1 Tax=Acidihalobacter yilgarnensis TaxID=2819280 RepID=A0A1D8ILW9_9GAMM|nr:polysaccharide deacetylase family protein [Acidihalobacter yilgarnensis]AOU97453.1 hypothetical protein BI364_05205 [Acidihalobacter yilgarnensis]